MLFRSLCGIPKRVHFRKRRTPWRLAQNAKKVTQFPPATRNHEAIFVFDAKPDSSTGTHTKALANVFGKCDLALAGYRCLVRWRSRRVGDYELQGVIDDLLDESSTINLSVVYRPVKLCPADTIDETIESLRPTAK